MADNDPVSLWLARLKEGESAAAAPLWEQFARQLQALVRRKLGATPRRQFDEEDVALSAFDSFYAGVAAGKFPQLENRDDLWRVLATIAIRKALRAAAQQRAEKRGGGQVRGESVFAGEQRGGLDLPDERSPDAWAVSVAEEIEHVVTSLGDESLRKVCVLLLQGYSQTEIAAALDCSERTIQRKLAIVREELRRSA